VSISLFSLVKSNELDFFRLQSFVGQRALDSIEIVSTERHQSPFSSKIVMEFVLQVNEAVVTFLGEGNVSQDSTDTDLSQIVHLE
jgi:hypothetical protein